MYYTTEKYLVLTFSVLFITSKNRHTTPLNIPPENEKKLSVLINLSELQ